MLVDINERKKNIDFFVLFIEPSLETGVAKVAC
jgi:hypothetical protein